MANTQHVTLVTPDMSCAHCQATITGDLSKLPGVSAVSASPETKLVEVDFDPGQLTIETIKGALAKAGYPAQDSAA